MEYQWVGMKEQLAKITVMLQDLDAIEAVYAH